MLRQRVIPDIATHSGQFDIVTIGAYEAPIWAKQGWLAKLNDFPASYGHNDLLPQVRAALTVLHPSVLRSYEARLAGEFVSRPASAMYGAEGVNYFRPSPARGRNRQRRAPPPANSAGWGSKDASPDKAGKKLPTAARVFRPR